jgi:hypothetical protein
MTIKESGPSGAINSSIPLINSSVPVISGPSQEEIRQAYNAFIKTVDHPVAVGFGVFAAGYRAGYRAAVLKIETE